MFSNLVDVSSFHLAMSFVFSTTVLSLYASYLTSSSVLIGFVPAVQQTAYYLPQLILARWGEKLSRMKPIVVRLSIFERLPHLCIALSILLFPTLPAAVAYAILVGSLLVSSAAAGLATPMWKAMLGKVIHADRRGGLFGAGFGIGGFLGIMGATLSRKILNTYSFPTSFGICFLCGFIGQILSWTGIALIREPKRVDEYREPDQKSYIRSILQELKTNRNFSRYLSSQTLIYLGTMGVSFYVIYARKMFQITDGFAATLTVFALVSQSLGALILGRIADRKGHKWFTEVATLLGLLAVGIIFLAQNRYWMYPVFFFMNMSNACLRVASMSITMEFCEPERIPTVTAIAHTALAIPLLLAPIIGGWIIDAFSYRTLFVVAALCYCAGYFTMRFRVIDPRKG